MPTETTAEDQQNIATQNTNRKVQTNLKMTDEELDTIGTTNVTQQNAKSLTDEMRNNKPNYSGPFGVPTPVTGAMNVMANLSIENQAKALEMGGLPVFSTGFKDGKPQISVGYNDKFSAKDLVGVQHTGLFGGTVFSGQDMYNPANFDKFGNYKDPFDTGDGGDDNTQSTLGQAVQAKAPPKVQQQKQEFAKAINRSPQEQLTKVRKPKAATGEFEAGGALVRRTKSLKSDRRGILGKPDTGKKTLLGA
jgi:hypothetical protein